MPDVRRLKDAHDVASEAAKGVVQLAPDGGTTAGQAVQASDPRLSDARTPTPHAASHATGGTDAVSAASIGAAAATDLTDHIALLANATDTDGHMQWEDKAKLDTYPNDIADVALLTRVALQTWVGPQKFDAAVTLSLMTEASVLFAGVGGLISQDNAQFAWDATLQRLRIGPVTPAAKLHVFNLSTPGVAYAAHRALQFGADAADPTGVVNTAEISGIYGLSRITALNTSNNTNSNGLSGLVGDVRTVAGAAGTITNVQTFLAQAIINAGNTILSNAYGMRIRKATNTGSGSITKFSGVAVEDQPNPVSSTLLLLGTLTAPAGYYSIYNPSPNPNYHAGSAGFGVTSPTAAVHIKAGVATANGAPLKLTSGVNLSTAEAGAFEYDGTELYFTPGATRQKVAFKAGIERTLGWYDQTAPAASAVTGPVYTLRNGGTVVGVSGNAEVNPTGSAATFDIEYKPPAGAWGTLFSATPSFSTAGVLAAGTLSTTALVAGTKLRRKWLAPNSIADVTVQLDLLTV